MNSDQGVVKAIQGGPPEAFLLGRGDRHDAGVAGAPSRFEEQSHLDDAERLLRSIRDRLSWADRTYVCTSWLLGKILFFFFIFSWLNC